MPARPAPPADAAMLRALFDNYLKMYATRDDALTTHFSEDFTGFTGGGHDLIRDRAAWVAITRQDFAQVKEPIRIEIKDVAIQSLAETIAVATGFFTIHLPIKDHILSRETARLVLIFRRESAGWKITHSSISIPYHLVREGEVYPLSQLEERNRVLEQVVAERTAQLSATNLRLQASEETYRSVLQASPDDITITDAAGRVVMVSPAAAQIFRCEPIAKFLGLSVFDFIVPADRARALSRATLRREHRLAGPSEYTGLRPDGTTFPIEVNTDFIRDSAGTVTGMVVIVRDITERKQAEAERDRLAAQNRQLQKAESLGRMAGAIAHHFNNQLHAVMMSLELAIDDLPPDSPTRPTVMIAREAARRASAVSQQMLAYLGQALSQPAALDLSALCRRCLPTWHAARPPYVTLTADLPASGPTIEADASQLEQVIANLLTNAWEACPAAGTVHLALTTVTAEQIPSANRFPVDGEPPVSSCACLTVTDNGSGIPAADLEKIFDPFFTSKFPGRGMGLAVSLGAIRAHGGVITVASEPGRGSVFQLFLPLSPATGS